MDALSVVGRVVDATVRSFHMRSVLGIDIGNSSIKVVQLRKENGVPVLETYGMIELAPYADLAVGESVHPESQRTATALLDLLAGAKASSRRGGFSLPLSASFTAILETPIRDQAQMRRIMPAEAKKYIPVPIESVLLDWRIISKPKAERPFETIESKAAVVAQKQRVLLVAMRNDAIEETRALAASANVSASFFEVELFSVARVAQKRLGEGTLMIDMGASGTKVYCVDEHGEVILSHLIPKGGTYLSNVLFKAGLHHFSEAEEAKRTDGLTGNTRQAMILKTELEAMLEEVNRVRVEYNNKENRSLTRTILFGGGALMKGVVPIAAEILGVETILAAPFSQVEGPEILADVFADVGPLYEVATGLALRALK